jgi:apolipoprotein N-acyltransferase
VNNDNKHSTHSKKILFAGFVATAAALTLAQAPIGWWPLAWVAYVPFIVACYQATIVARRSSLVSRTTSYEPPPTTTFEGRLATGHEARTLCLAAYIVGAFYWLGNLYWISFVTVSGWIAFCLYTAILWPILAITLRWCINRKIPLFISVPILVVGMEQTQGLFLGGFYWDYLAHSQYANIRIIQIADIFGAAGVSFLVGMVNGLVAEIIFSIRDKSGLLKPTLQSIFVVAAVVVAVVYGKWRIDESDKYITNGPMIGAVQTNIPQSVKQSFAAEGQIFDELVANNKQCVEAGAKFIVWPETMVQAILEREVLRLIDNSHSYNVFDKAIKEQARMGAYILVGAYGGSPHIEDNFDIRMAQKFNAAFLYKPDGNQSPQKYYKIHLVPFGEYIPFTDIPLIYNLLLKMTPYDFDYTLNAGTEFTVFEIRPAEANLTYKFSVMICYEDAVPVIARQFALDEEGHKRIDWLVNISNDGWFVRFGSTRPAAGKNDKVMPSSELAQHTAVCAFRAVENRTAIIRSVNTGISCLIDSFGRVRNGYKAGNLPQNAFDREGMAGWFADVVPIDSRVSFFSKYGQWLDLSCQLCFAGIIMIQVAGLIRRRKMKLKTTKQ